MACAGALPGAGHEERHLLPEKQVPWPQFSGSARTGNLPRSNPSCVRLRVRIGRRPRRGLVLCGRCPCSASLFPPQAAVACAAIPVRVTGFLPSQGLHIKKSTRFLRSRCLGRSFQVLPARGISRALKTFRRNVFVRRSKRRTRAFRFPYGSPGFCPPKGCT